MKPLVERLKKEYAGKVEFRRYVDAGSPGSDPAGVDLAEQIGLQYYPTFLFVNSDGSLAGQPVIGGQTEAQLRQRLDALE